MAAEVPYPCKQRTFGMVAESKLMALADAEMLLASCFLNTKK
jgi:hypothetical protein